MLWLKLLAAVPTIIQTVRQIEEAAGTVAGQGEEKKALVIAAVQAAISAVGTEIDAGKVVAFVTDVINISVAFFNKLGIFKKGATT